MAAIIMTSNMYEIAAFLLSSNGFEFY